MRPIKVKEPCFKFARQDIKIENTNGTLAAVNASALPTANLDFIGLSFGAIFETKPAPALAVGSQLRRSIYSTRHKEDNGRFQSLGRKYRRRF
jgi:hypothetical protein